MTPATLLAAPPGPIDWIDQLQGVLFVAAVLAFLGMMAILVGMLLEDYGKDALAGAGKGRHGGDDGTCGVPVPLKPKPPGLTGGAAVEGDGRR